ncbi:unnamed protein product, partial [Oppiella nova]
MYFNESDISLECKTVANYVSAHQNEDWALKLIDASGVVGAGLAKGNYQFMGDFDECLDVKVTLEGDQKIHGITGQYCTLNLPMEAVVGRRSSKNQALDIESLHLTPTIGVVCLVMDTGSQSYWIRVYDMQQKVLAFEQELYHTIQYKVVKPNFHTFSTPDGQVGLNFANREEAQYLGVAVTEIHDRQMESLKSLGWNQL